MGAAPDLDFGRWVVSERDEHGGMQLTWMPLASARRAEALLAERP